MVGTYIIYIIAPSYIFWADLGAGCQGRRSCSTSYPSGNQVDGSPLVAMFCEAAGGYPLCSVRAAGGYPLCSGGLLEGTPCVLRRCWRVPPVFCEAAGGYPLCSVRLLEGTPCVYSFCFCF